MSLETSMTTLYKLLDVPDGGAVAELLFESVMADVDPNDIINELVAIVDLLPTDAEPRATLFPHCLRHDQQNIEVEQL